MRRYSLVLAMFLAAAGCRREAAEHPGTGPSASAAPESRLQKARRLALAPTSENTAVDRKLLAFRKTVEKHPRPADVFVELGRTWILKARETSDPGYYLNAEACADIVLDLLPGDKRALDLRASVRLNNHEFGEARDIAQAIVDADPEAVSAWGTLSDALLELGLLEDADRAAQRMLELKPSLSSYSRVSYFQWLAGNTRGAIESARLAIDAGGGAGNSEALAWVLVQAAMLFWHEGDYEGADAGFAQARQVLRDYPPALVGQGRVALAQGNAQKAVESLERAFRASPLVETAWLLGEARELAGDAEGAQHAFALAEKEGKGGDRRTLSLMYSTRKTNHADALRLAEHERKTRGDVYTEDALAWALYRAGRFADAKTAIDRARRYGTPDARLLFHQGAIEKALGDKKHARESLTAALKANPRFDLSGAAEARALLEEL